MQSCEPPAALNVLLWPVVVPKNRVGGSPAFSFVFAFQYIGETLDTPAENAGCGYDFASGVHKYLYGADDPVNLDDPSGNDYGDFDIRLSSILAPLFSVSAFGTAGGSMLGTALEEEPLGSFSPYTGNGFAYYFEANTKRTRKSFSRSTGYPALSYGKTIVEDGAGVSKMKSDVADIKAKGYKIGLMSFYGHGTPNQELGNASGAAIFWGDPAPSGVPNVLDQPDFRNIFSGILSPNVEVDLNFCYSLNGNGLIPKFLRTIAPQADVWGAPSIDGSEWIGYGDYGPLYGLVHYSNYGH